MEDASAPVEQVAEAADDNSNQADRSPKKQEKANNLPSLGLAALGIVFGDIGTSPLYTFKTVLSDAGNTDRATILGALSLLVWTLVIIATLKYVVVAMRADNDGEGGILALMSLVKKTGGGSAAIVAAGLFGAALIYGDGVITPAISVLSALEGLPQAIPAVKPYVLPMAVGVLLALFIVQPFGTARIGKVFGPIMLIWFAVLAIFGLMGIVEHPAVLAGLSPAYGLSYLAHGGFTAFALLGAVFLCTTGAEALYADMGHFGKRPIRLSWLAVVFPSLVLNYAGQAGIVLDGAPAKDNIFFDLFPHFLLVPMVLLATMATVIASQAIITGSFSMTRQAVQLGWLPRLIVRQTSSEGYGQIYIGGVNWILMVATLALTLAFRSSDNLSAAYGMAVATTMLLTTVLLFNAMRDAWGWSSTLAGAVASGFAVVDLAFFGSNLLKVHKGGWVPLVIAAGVYGLMVVWHRGVEAMRVTLYARSMPLAEFFAKLETDGVCRPAGTGVFLSRTRDDTPPLMAWHVRQNRSLYKDVLIVEIVNALVPRIADPDRFAVEKGAAGLWRIRYHVGFMERVRLEEALPSLKGKGCEADLGHVIFYLGHETIKRAPAGKRRLLSWTERGFALMERNQAQLSDVLGLPSDKVVEIGRQIEL